jgi:tripartite-type tricarboxylate transporter receptor subunit TctC
MQEPDVRERFAAMGSEGPTVRSPREFTAFVERELKTYAALVRRSGATVD